MKKNGSMSFGYPTNFFSVDQQALTPFAAINRLSQISNPNFDNTLAGSLGIHQLLSALGNQIHLIHPDFGSVHSMLSSRSEERQEAVLAYAKAIAGFKSNGDQHHGLVQQDGGVLTKPIVMILNTQGVKARHRADAMASGGSHWVSCVILPKNYVTPNGVAIGNPQEIVYFVDPLYQNRKLPLEFKAILSEGFQCNFEVEGQLFNHTIVAPFPEMVCVDEINVFQQAEGSLDCGWWAVYNALKIIQTGSTEFLQYFRGAHYQRHERQNRKMASQLRGCFPQLVDVADNADTKRKPPSKSKSTEMQAAILASINSYQSYLVRNDAIPGRRGNDYQTLLLMQSALKNHFDGLPFTLKTEIDDGTDLDDFELCIKGKTQKYQIKHGTNRDVYYTPASFLKVTASKLMNPKHPSRSSETGGAPLVHFFESWYRCLYVDKRFPEGQVEFGLISTYGLNDTLKKLYNEKTLTFNADYIIKSSDYKEQLGKAAVKFSEDITSLINNLKILKGKSKKYKDLRILQFFTTFKLKLGHVYINDLEQDIRDLLRKNNVHSETIYRSLYYHFNNWIREHLSEKNDEASRALTITHDSTKNLLVDLTVQAQILQRLIGVSQANQNHIVTDISGVTVERLEAYGALLLALENKVKVFFVSGEQGVGKSAFVKQFIIRQKWTHSTLFIKDLEDLVITADLLQRVGGINEILKYFVGIDLIVIDSAEHWLHDQSGGRQSIIAAVLQQTKIPVVFTITKKALAQFIKIYGSKNLKSMQIPIKPLSIPVITERLKTVASDETVRKILSNTALAIKCSIPFWLNQFLQYFESFSSLFDEYEEVVLEKITQVVVAGKDPEIAEARRQIWMRFCSQPQETFNAAINLDDFNSNEIESLCRDRVLIKKENATYILQHDLYYDIGFRVYFDQKLAAAKSKGRYGSLVKIINQHHENAGIQVKISQNIALLAKHINEVSPAIITLIAAAIYSDEEGIAEKFIALLDDKSKLKNIKFLGGYYADAYQLAIKYDDRSVIICLGKNNVPLYYTNEPMVDFVPDQSSSSSSEEVFCDDPWSSSDGSEDVHSYTLDEPLYDQYEDWYKSPQKYQFANFKMDYYYDEDEIEADYDDKPSYNNHFQYLITAHQSHGYAAFQTLLFQHQWLLTAVNNFGESLLHYAVLLNNHEIIKDILYCFGIYGVNIDTSDQLGETALHNACYNEDIEVIEMLLEAGANPNCANNFDVSPLHLAIAIRNQNIIALMLEYGANITLSCRNEMPMLDFIAKVEDDIDNDEMILFYQEKTKCENSEFSESLDSLLNNSQWSDDRSHLLYWDESSEFDYLLDECGQYFEAIDVLSEINADNIAAVINTMEQHGVELQCELFDHLTNMHDAWLALAIYAFEYQDKCALAYISEEDLGSIMKELLEAASDNEEMLALIKNHGNKPLGGLSL